MRLWLILVIALGILEISIGQESKEHDDDHIYTEVGFTFSHFEQQVKSEIGGVKGDLLVDDTNLSIGLLSGYKVLHWLSAGVYLRYDSGTRSGGEFGGVDGSGQTVLVNGQGGDYSELWLGPFARFHYRKLYLSLGYGLVGSRFDESRNDITSINGTSDGSFSLDPSVAFIFNIGGSANITDHLEATFGIEYRARYYNMLDGDVLADNIVLGTQNITPLMGLRYNW